MLLKDAHPLLPRPRIHIVVAVVELDARLRDARPDVAELLLHEDARRRQEDRPLRVRRKAAHRLVEQVANEADGDERLPRAGGQQRHDVALGGLGEDGSLEEKKGRKVFEMRKEILSKKKHT